jgi:hypothetical protein
MDGDPNVPTDFSFLSPPTSSQPLPDPASPQHYFLSLSPPSVTLDDFSTNPPFNDPSVSLSIYEESMSEDVGSISYTSDDPPTYDYDYSSYSNSDISTHPPPSSNAPTEISSAVASDSDLLPPQTKSSKQIKQTGLLNFFPVIPGDEAHAMWGKRKRANLERDEEQRAETIRKEGKWKEQKLTHLRERNSVSQQKRRKTTKAQEIQAGIRDKDGNKLPVSELLTLRIFTLMYFKMTTELDHEIQVPPRAEVAAASRPKRAIVAEMKRQKQEKAGKDYQPSKRDIAAHSTINWKSPTFWSMIQTAADEQRGKPNLSKLVDTLRQRDSRFGLLSHRRVGEWRDKTVVDRIAWSEKTIAEVKKEFLPGGHQTHYNVFVSVHK